jgi:hypothetical protein
MINTSYTQHIRIQMLSIHTDSMLVFWVLMHCRRVGTYQRVGSPSSGLKTALETVCFSETLVSTYKSTWRYYPEDQHQYIDGRENLKSHKRLLTLS